MFIYFSTWYNQFFISNYVTYQNYISFCILLFLQYSQTYYRLSLHLLFGSIWGSFMKIPTCTHLHTLELNTNSLTCLTHFDNKLYFGSGGGFAYWDNTIRIWNTETHEEIAILEGHTECVHCFTLHENKLYSGSDDNTIRIWKLYTFEDLKLYLIYESLLTHVVLL